MAVELGYNPWFLLLLTLLELFLVVIPALVASKIDKKSFAHEIGEMGFHKKVDPLSKNALKILAGLCFGFIFFLIGGYILWFFKNIVVENLFGTTFVEKGAKNAITAEPMQPNYLQLTLLIKCNGL